MGRLVVGSAALARRLEIAEALSGAACAEAMNLMWPDTNASTLQIAGGYAVFAGAVSPVTQAIGVGMGVPVSAEDIDQIEDYYRERRANPNIHLCPLADNSLAEHLGMRGYRPVEFTSMMVRPVMPEDANPEPCTEVAVRVLDETESTLWASTVMRGFLEREELTEAELVFQAIAGADRTTVRVLAEINGQPVGGAGHAVREGVGMFYGDSTLVNFRSRGIQTALIRERLKLLRSQGAELAAASVIPGSISQRNYERCGFVVAYTKVAMLKDLVTS